MDPLDDYAAALRVLESHLARRRLGAVESDEDMLLRHQELRDILVAMLPAAETIDQAATGSAARSTAWLGLPSAGDAIGGYRVVRTLGQGGMGVVFLAEDLRLGRRVALKLVRPERLGSGVARERFWREAKLAARLEHPNICPVYEVGEVSGMPFMAMRYIEGETLAARIAARQAQPGAPSTRTPSGSSGASEEMVALIERVAAAVHYAHERGVVHRDLKPLNIIIDGDGVPFVLDFGMANDVDDALALTNSGEFVGTLYYMPPEHAGQRRASSTPDRRVDVYALGITLYEAVTGVRPFDGASIGELLHAIARHSAPPVSRRNPSLPRDLDVVVAKAIEKDPDRRYKTAADLGEDLRRVRMREPVRARRAGAILRLRRWVQRNPLATSFMLVVAAAAVAVAYLYLRAQDAYLRELSARSNFELVAMVPRLRELESQEAAAYAAWPDHLEALLACERIATALVVDARAVEDFHSRLTSADLASRDFTRRFLRDTLSTFLQDLTRITDAETGLLARVRRNSAWAERAAARTIDAHRTAWERASAAIAAAPRYRGLRLTPQVDLVPIGPDPASELWEFGHPRSGRVPERGADGRLVLGDDTSLVFVLLPGGLFAMGCQDLDPAQPNYDPNARSEEGPVQQVELDAFFLAKHELSQGQWQRLGDGTNPSDFRPGASYSMPTPMSLTNPVERVAWPTCVALLRQHGLELPTEAQWEYGCRGGTTTPWWTGSDSLSLSGRVNLADRAAKEAGLRLVQIDEDYDDGFALHAPVDALAPNPYGLYHIAGNVWEWCRDAWSKGAPRTGDGLRAASATGPWVHRGGTFAETSIHCRSAFRRQGTAAENTIGVRPARRVRPQS